MKKLFLLTSICLNKNSSASQFMNRRTYSCLLELKDLYKPIKYQSYNTARNHIINFKNKDTYTGKISKKKSLEHIWPQSYYNKPDKNKKKDMHLLTQIDLKTNIFRSNYKFVDNSLLWNSSIFFKTIPLKDNYHIRKNTKDKLFYLPDIAKGEVSRSLAYTILIYPELINNLDNVINKDDLINWCLDYPVCQNEINKNNLIKDVQGNNNPFVLDNQLILIFKNI